MPDFFSGTPNKLQQDFPPDQRANLAQNTQSLASVAEKVDSNLFNGGIVSIVPFVAGGQVRIEHKLGHTPNGYVIVRIISRATPDPVSYTEVSISDTDLVLATDFEAVVGLLVF